MKKSELREMTVKQLRELVRDNDLEIVGAWKMKKNDLVEEIYELVFEAWEIEDDETIEETTEETVAEEVVEEVEEEPKRRRHGKTIKVFKDGEEVIQLNSLTETFKWAADNKICNQGWVKESLRSGRETTPGFRYKEGGYLFKYVK